MVNAIVYIFLGATILVSFWSALVEATFLTVRPISLASASADGNKRATQALMISNEKTKLVSTTTLVDTTSNVVLASTIGLILSDYFGPIGWVYSALIGSLGIMVFLYLLPKAIGIENSVRMAIWLAPSSLIVLDILAPIAVPLTSVARKLSYRIVGQSGYQKVDLVGEFEDLVGMLEKEGHIEPDAGKILRSAMLSSKNTAGDVLTPEGETISVPLTSTVLDALKIMGKSNHPRLPVYDKQSDRYVGAITFRALSTAVGTGKLNERIADHVIQAARVEISESLTTVMDRMQKAKSTIAFVYSGGKFVGVITLTDIIEQLLGVKL
ncbi:MAG: CNNM domain-containing protein [Thaumarchaeota archaeon]|nr:CNNM domain-containing protein [Nitrososphaerota archaeon]